MIKKSMASLCVLFCVGCAMMHPPGQFEQREVTETPREKVLNTLKVNIEADKPILEGSVGVLPFKEQGKETGLGIAATEFFTSNLTLVKEFDLIDMSYANLLEAEFSLFSPDKKQKALRAEQVITGFVTLTGKRLFIHGMQRRQETVEYDKLAMMEGGEKDFFRLVADLDIQFLKRNGITVTQEIANQFYTIPTQNLQAYILYAKGRQAESMFDYDGARAAYQEASKADPDFKQARECTQHMEQLMTAAPQDVAAAPQQSGSLSEGVLTTTVEQPPSIEEQNVPTTENTGTVIIRFDLP